MFDIKTLLRLMRINDNSTVSRIPWILPQILIFPLILLISPQNIFSYNSIIVFLANIFLTASGFVINDVEDAADDYLVLEKRKRNPISSGELTKKQGHLVGLSLLFIGLSLLLTISYLVFLVGFALISVGILYSWKPIRLKSIPIMDIISHVIGLGALQLSTTYLTFSSFNLQFISLLIIVIPFSVAAEFFQELRDFEIDKKTKINNTIQKLGKINPQKLIIILSIIATLGGVLFFHASSLNMNMVLIIPFMFLSAIIYIECTFKNFNFKK